MIKAIDIVAIFIFSHAFYFAVITLIFFSSLFGGFLLLSLWELWKFYERWRIFKKY